MATDAAHPAPTPLPAPPEPEAFGQRYFPHDPRGEAARRLHGLLCGIDPESPLTDRIAWLEALAHWVLTPHGRVKRLVGADGAEDTARTARLRILVQALEEIEAFRTRTSRLVVRLLADTKGFSLFCETGLPAQPAFTREAIDRLSRALLPRPPDDQDLAELVLRLFPHERDADWLHSLPTDLVVSLGASLAASGQDPFLDAREEMSDAAQVIAARVATLGLSEDVRRRSPDVPIRESPFLRLPRLVDALLRADEGEAREAARAEVSRTHGEIRRTLRSVHSRLEEAGVSVDLVYRIELVGRNLERLSELLALARPKATQPPDESARRARFLLGSLVKACAQDRSIVGLVRANGRQLARKVIERAGHTGEHYITSSRREWHAMITSAGGGGFLTAFTAALKFLVVSLHAPYFFDFLLNGLNYAGSFVLMQALGFTLATKQPSMTAAALAAQVKEAANGGHELEGLVELIQRITRSQLAAAIGNLGMVIPAALGVEFLYRAWQGRSFLDLATAEYVVQSLKPFSSAALIWAALTGAILWFSSVVAGATENWVVYRRLPEAIARHRRLVALFGEKFCQKLSEGFLHSISGVVGSVTLGFLLAATPVAGKFFGVPLSVAHVTLSTGSLVLAGAALGPLALWKAGVAGAAGGILLIGSLNFGVSFALALNVAFRAREVHSREVVGLGVSLLRRLRSHPMDFLRPPPEAKATEQVAPVLPEGRSRTGQFATHAVVAPAAEESKR